MIENIIPSSPSDFVLLAACQMAGAICNGLMLAGVSLELCAIHADRADFVQAQVLGQLQYAPAWPPRQAGTNAALNACLLAVRKAQIERQTPFV